MKRSTDWQALEALLVSEGWTYLGRTSDNHFKYRAPAGHEGHHIFTLPQSPGGGRGLRNARARMRRAGIKFPSKGQ